MIRNKKGFTLIELMIVMAIIGILAVVALVAISGKSVEARDARRLADANAIQFAFSLHAVDHGSDYLEGSDDAILLHDLANRADLSYLSLDNVKDPISSRTDTCYNGGVIIQCNQAGGYTIFDMYDDVGDIYLGTFDNYAIGIKLEQTEIASLDMDWRKFVGIKPAYAAGCDYNLVCDGEEDIDSCPCDCGGVCDCNFSGFCDIPIENALNCPADCAGGGFCGDFICNGLENPFTCPGDCLGGGETDTNDWLYIGPAGVRRSAVDEVDLYDYTYSD